MTRNLSLLKRSGNRVGARPPPSQSGESPDNDAAQPLDSNRKEKKISEKRALRDDGACFWDNLRGKLFFLHSYSDNNWKASFGTIFKLLFSIRVTSSFWSIISDCDEVYNYWEPLHLLLYGRGFQTWEYSPVYAIRSWFYIYIHYIPAQLLFPLLSTSKVAFFHILRVVIGFVSLSADICLYESACRRLGNRIGLLYIVFSIFSVGMFNASCAFLPSSFSMTLNSFAMAAYLQEKWFLSIFCTAVSALVGWPFAAVLGLPIVLEMLLVRTKRLSIRFILISLASAAVVIPSLYFVDTFYYGKNVLAPLNIVLYNVFSGHGPDLYGVEPASYYVKNLLLNWNILIILATLSLPLSLWCYVDQNSAHKQELKKNSRSEYSLPYWYRYIPVIFMYLTASLWLLVFFLQPHKEERFLFPIYPLIALLAAVALDSIVRLFSRTSFVGVLITAMFVLVSLSRGIALHRNFSATLETYKGFHDHFIVNQNRTDFAGMQNPIRLCVGKEWHRFQSSFFLPEMATDRNGIKRSVELQFLQSEFKGLLPKAFPKGPIPNITRQIPSAMNDLNLEEPTRYVQLNTCDFLIDLQTSKVSAREPNYATMDRFSIVQSLPFLLAEESHPIFRAFYLPFTDHLLKYGNMVLLQTRQ